MNSTFNELVAWKPGYVVSRVVANMAPDRHVTIKEMDGANDEMANCIAAGQSMPMSLVKRMDCLAVAGRVANAAIEKMIADV